ncbi:MAG: hypothetical protein ACKOAO_03705 [Oxalobacteraceae bacterium]
MQSSSPQQPATYPETADLSLHERQRREVLQTLAHAGQRAVVELTDMSETERCKWLFWNLHENLDELRLMEPTLSARVTGAQFTVVDGARLLSHGDTEKRLDLSCRWSLALSYPSYEDELVHAVGEGWINLVVARQAPAYLTVHEGQRAYLDADHTTYPNQIYLEGWITPSIWKEMSSYLSNPNPTCRTDVVLLDNVLFPVKRGFDFVQGPPASVGVVAIEFRAFSHPMERRVSRRAQTRSRS